MSILITGFEPFGGESINPAWQVAQAFQNKNYAEHVVHAYCLPTAFGDSLQMLGALMALHQPNLVLCIGQAAGRSAISLERIAINIDDARIADNLGAQPIDEPVIEGAPAAYFCTLPIKAIVQQLNEAGIPAEVSNSAGTFVCNHVFYGLMHHVAVNPDTKAGFVHIPFLPEQAVNHKNTPSMALADVIQAIDIIIHTSMSNSKDLRITAGKVC
jgi:pyroglutamyl-peptidase